MCAAVWSLYDRLGGVYSIASLIVDLYQNWQTLTHPE